jgi:AcrR family transcriptional regulator
MPPSPRRDATRRQILEAAEAVFADKGFDGASIDLIVERAGVARGTVYYNFDSKEAIALSLATAAMAEVDAMIRPRLLAGDNPETLIFDLVRGSCRWFIAHHAIARVILTAPLRDPVLASSPPADRPSFRRLVSDIVTEGQRRAVFRTDIDASGLAQIIGAVFSQALLVGLDHDQPGLEAWLASLIRVLFEGLRPREH